MWARKREDIILPKALGRLGSEASLRNLIRVVPWGPRSLNLETLCRDKLDGEAPGWGVEVEIQQLWLDRSWDFLWDREYGKGGVGGNRIYL